MPENMTARRTVSKSSPARLRPSSASLTTASGSISRTTFCAARLVFPVKRPCVARCFVKRQ